MLLADSSVWIDFLRNGDAMMFEQLGRGAIVIHPMVIGEVALGHLRQRAETIGKLRDLPRLAEVESCEFTALVEQLEWVGCGFGFVDAHLLASVYVAGDVLLWTRDKRLRRAADALGLSAEFD